MHSKVSRSDLAKIIAKLSMTNNLDQTKLAKEVAGYLLTNNMLDQLEPLMRDIQKIWADDFKFVNINAETAFKVELKDLNLLISPFKSLFDKTSNFLVTPIINHKLIGGARLGIGELRLDLSLRAKLNKFNNFIQG